MMPIQTLVSPMSLEEAEAALNGNASIIDVKNPQEGSLGAQVPSVIRSVRRLVPEGIPVSATIGDVPNLPGTCAQAALGAAVAGADYVKVGLMGPSSLSEARSVMSAVVRAVKEYDSRKRVVACLYSDWKRAGTIDPRLLPELAAATEAEVVLLDTAIKDGRSTLDFMTTKELRQLVKRAHHHNLVFALAGSLTLDHLDAIVEISPDIVGVRGAVCACGDRVNGTIVSERVREFVETLNVASANARVRV